MSKSAIWSTINGRSHASQGTTEFVDPRKTAMLGGYNPPNTEYPHTTAAVNPMKATGVGKNTGDAHNPGKL